MKINYKETTSDLLKRIDIHSKFGSRDIDQWMLGLLKLNKGMKILDVACGAGKQCFSFYHFLNGEVEILGGDVSKELLAQARKEAVDQKAHIEFMDLNFNQPFPLGENRFDLLSCCFAIYYAEDIPFTIRQMHRVLAPGGRLFTTGPMPENKQLFYDIIKEATNKPIPPMPGSSRYGSAILSSIRETFCKVEVHIFENPLVFETVEPFMDYTRASLSEDRKLWTSLFNGPDEFEALMEKINAVATRRLAAEGKLVMTKVVGGFIATK
ncbi:methylase [Longilinea arvoryzae]|uniref:Methylase n=1 Tax=Longilinea arvoryzae TaxID=360412 RepID=A0A0S7BBE8_9CHLR|nr:methyltransferase domain-containing protein [Longilinea arvoryzae]GAP14942.1 methylase [Longilinea arvoryzae]